MQPPLSSNPLEIIITENINGKQKKKNKLASLGATLVRNYDPASSDLLTGVKCRATTVGVI